jgi:hypothetical protein
MYGTRDLEKERFATRKYYKRNRVRLTSIAREKSREMSKWMNSLKEGKPCSDCGIAYPHYVMDWDHVRGIKARASLTFSKISEQ